MHTCSVLTPSIRPSINKPHNQSRTLMYELLAHRAFCNGGEHEKRDI